MAGIIFVPAEKAQDVRWAGGGEHANINTTYLVTAELFVASNLSVFLQRNTMKVRRN